MTQNICCLFDRFFVFLEAKPPYKLVGFDFLNDFPELMIDEVLVFFGIDRDRIFRIFGDFGFSFCNPFSHDAFFILVSLVSCFVSVVCVMRVYLFPFGTSVVIYMETVLGIPLYLIVI